MAQNETTSRIPQQRLPISKKTKKWREQCVEGYIALSDIHHVHGDHDVERFYRYYNGDIDDSDYKHVLKPYGKSRKNFPSEIRNFPIIKPIIDLLLGEKSKRPLNYSVTVQNADAVTMKEQAKMEALYQNLQQRFLQEVGDEAMAQGANPEELELPENLMRKFEDSYVDNRAIMGEKAMNYIFQKCEMYDQFQKAWFHFLVAGECYSHRGVRNGEPFYEVLNPLDVDYDKDPDVEFVEDGDWALVKKAMHVSSVIDNFGTYLTDEQVLNLEDPTGTNVDIAFSAVHNEDRVNKNALIEVVTVYWKSRKRIGFMQYVDPVTNSIEEMTVEDGYKITPEMKEQGARIKWEWINEVWEGTRIDDKHYINIHPVVNQRTSIDHPSVCKLPINGRVYSTNPSSNMSVVGIGVPYQLTYNIYKYRLELAIARSKDIIAQFDINMIPKKWDMDKFMYYVEGTGIAWVDYNKEGIQLNPQHQSVMDMSIKTIQQYITLLESIVIEWERVSGVNRQRQGQVGAYEGKATSQQAIMQSSHITEDLFRRFARFEQRDMQALLDYSKEAWLTGKKTTYVMPDGTTEFLNVDSMSHMESEYGIFVSDSGRDQDKLDQIRQLGLSMIQNGMPMSTVVDVMESESFIGIKSKMRAAEKAQQELQEAQQQQAMQEKQMAIQSAEEIAKAQIENENLNNEKDRQNKIDVALINAGARADGDMVKNASQEGKDRRDQDLREREIELKERGQRESERANISKENITKEKNKNDAKKQNNK